MHFGPCTAVRLIRQDQIPGNGSPSDLKFVPGEATHAFDFADSPKTLVKRRFSVYHTILSDIPLGMQFISIFRGREVMVFEG